MHVVGHQTGRTGDQIASMAEHTANQTHQTVNMTDQTVRTTDQVNMTDQIAGSTVSTVHQTVVSIAGHTDQRIANTDTTAADTTAADQRMVDSRPDRTRHTLWLMMLCYRRWGNWPRGRMLKYLASWRRILDFQRVCGYRFRLRQHSQRNPVRPVPHPAMPHLLTWPVHRKSLVVPLMNQASGACIGCRYSGWRN